MNYVDHENKQLLPKNLLNANFFDMFIIINIQKKTPLCRYETQKIEFKTNTLRKTRKKKTLISNKITLYRKDKNCGNYFKHKKIVL